MGKKIIPIGEVRVDENLRNIALVEISDGVVVRKSPHGIKSVSLSEENGEYQVKVKPGRISSVSDCSVTDSSGTEVPVRKGDDNTFFFPAIAGRSYSVRVTSCVNFLLILLLAAGLLALAVGLGSLFFCCGNPSDAGTPSAGTSAAVGEYTTAPVTTGETGPQGEYTVEDSRRPPEVTTAPEADNRTITFAGFGKYSVSALATDVELSNPAVNFVNMKYTLIDDATGETVARTGLVAPGKYVYVNVMEYYQGKTGVFNVSVVIETFDEYGTQMNGITQKMILHVE